MKFLDLFYSYWFWDVLFFAEADIFVTALNVIHNNLLEKDRERRKRILSKKELWFTYDMSTIHINNQFVNLHWLILFKLDSIFKIQSVGVTFLD